MPQRKNYRQLSKKQVLRRLKSIYEAERESSTSCSSSSPSSSSDENGPCRNIPQHRHNDDSPSQNTEREEIENVENYVQSEESMNLHRPSESSSTSDDYSSYSDNTSHDGPIDQPNFGTLASKLNSWAVQCNIRQIHLKKLLAILRQAGHNLPKDPRSMQHTPRSTELFSCPPGMYFHYGLQKSIVDQMKRFGQLQTSEIAIDLNIDGLPLAKSSKSQLWPILGKIQHKYFNQPFLIGAYHGYGKPSSVNDFLEGFIAEYKTLNANGFYFNEKHYTVTIRCVICDTPARNFVTCTKGHNAYFGCGKCMEEGEYRDHRMLFLSEYARLRTDNDFKRRIEEEHHTGISIFEEILRMVSQFPLDYMHLVCLGVMKKLLLLWIEGHIDVKLSARNAKRLSDLLIDLARSIPVEFARKPRTIEEIRRWKATEFRLFLLYLGPTILHHFFPEDYVMHFNSLNCAIRILSDQDDCQTNNAYAKELLVFFVQQFKRLYGEANIIYNIHNLIHINEDVKLYGNLDAFSSFPYENFLQTLLHTLRKATHPLQQLHRRTVEKTSQHPHEPLENIQYPSLIRPIKDILPMRCHKAHRFIQFENFQISTERPNNCCYLTDGSIVLVKHIGYKQNLPIIIGQKFVELSEIPHYPIDSRKLNMCTAAGLSPLQIWNVGCIKRKAVMICMDNLNYIMPLLHNSH